MTNSQTILLSLLISALAVSNPLGADAKSTKGRKATHRSQGHYFVPPPPAYTPSLSPMYDYERISQAKKASPYSKYIKYAPGYGEPPVTKPNKYVTYYGS
jgi:hypothetical protein